MGSNIYTDLCIHPGGVGVVGRWGGSGCGGLMGRVVWTVGWFLPGRTTPRGRVGGRGQHRLTTQVWSGLVWSGRVLCIHRFCVYTNAGLCIHRSSKSVYTSARLQHSCIRVHNSYPASCSTSPRYAKWFVMLQPAALRFSHRL